jgi:Tfp pilus assembly protein PilO
MVSPGWLLEPSLLIMKQKIELRMKILIWLLILAVATFLGYQYYLKSISEEEREVRHLEKEFRRATDLYVSAMRQAGEIGLAAIADPEAAVNKVKAVRDRLGELMAKLSEEKAIVRARALEDQIINFCRRNEID